jgi:hypothetical protein
MAAEKQSKAHLQVAKHACKLHIREHLPLAQWADHSLDHQLNRPRASHKPNENNPKATACQLQRRKVNAHTKQQGLQVTHIEVRHEGGLGLHNLIHDMLPLLLPAGVRHAAAASERSSQTNQIAWQASSGLANKTRVEFCGAGPLGRYRAEKITAVTALR